MREYAMTINVNGVRSMITIAKEIGVPVDFGEPCAAVGEDYRQVFSDNVENARKLRKIYNERVRKPFTSQCYKDM